MIETLRTEFGFPSIWGLPQTSRPSTLVLFHGLPHTPSASYMASQVPARAPRASAAPAGVPPPPPLPTTPRTQRRSAPPPCPEAPLPPPSPLVVSTGVQQEGASCPGGEVPLVEKTYVEDLSKLPRSIFPPTPPLKCLSLFIFRSA